MPEGMTIGEWIKAPTTEPLTASVAVPIQTVRDRFRDEGTVTPTPAAEAWRYWSCIGELHYATMFMARQVSRLAWDVLIDGEKQERPRNKEWPQILDAATFPAGVRNVSKLMTLNFEVPGAFYYLQDAAGEWEVAATTRPKLAERKERAAHAIWAINPHPENPSRPDSPTLANMDTIRELALLQALKRSQLRNRLQRGILLYPAEGEFPDDVNFEDDFEEAQLAPVRDEYAPSALNPLIIKYPGDLIEKWRYMSLDSNFDEQLTEDIGATTQRLAIGMDMPPEAMMGIGSMTHWSVWQVSESTYRAHMEPWAMDVGNVFARAIHRLRADAAEVEVIPDPTPVLAKLGSVTDGLEAFDRGIVNGEFVRGLMGADDDNAPTAAEAQQQNGGDSRIRRLSSDRTGPPAERPAPTPPG